MWTIVKIGNKQCPVLQGIQLRLATFLGEYIGPHSVLKTTEKGSVSIRRDCCHLKCCHRPPRNTSIMMPQLCFDGLCGDKKPATHSISVEFSSNFMYIYMKIMLFRKLYEKRDISMFSWGKRNVNKKVCIRFFKTSSHVVRTFRHHLSFSTHVLLIITQYLCLQDWSTYVFGTCGLKSTLSRSQLLP